MTACIRMKAKINSKPKNTKTTLGSVVYVTCSIMEKKKGELIEPPCEK